MTNRSKLDAFLSSLEEQIGTRSATDEERARFKRKPKAAKSTA